MNASVKGNVRVPSVASFTLAKGADIKGTLTYNAPIEATRSDTAKVSGDIEYTQTALPGIDIGNMLWVLITMTLLACAVHGVFLKKLAQFASVTHARKGTAALVGIGGFIATPFVVVLLFIPGVTVPLGSILLALFIAFTTTAYGFAAIILGLYTYRFHQKIMIPTWTTTLIGAVVMTVLIVAVPFIALLVALTVPLGVLILETYRTMTGKGK